MRILGSVLALSITVGAQAAPAAYQGFSQPCDTVRPAATQFLQLRGFTVTAGSGCESCIEAQTKRLQDAEGHHFLSNRKVIQRYTTKSLEYEKSGPFVQKVHVEMSVKAHLHLLPTGNSCQADLRFAYSWYGAQMILGFPVDGDPGHGDSNGKLEAAYLQALDQQMTRVTVADR